MPDLTPIQWMLAVLAAASMGISKGGLAGLSLIAIAPASRLPRDRPHEIPDPSPEPAPSGSKA